MSQSPIETRVHRKCTAIIRQMPNVAEHTTTNSPRWSYCKVCQGAIKNAKSKPCLRRELEGTTKEIPDDIGVADDDFEFMLGVRLEWAVAGIGFVWIRRSRQRRIFRYVTGGRRRFVVSQCSWNMCTIEIFAKCIFNARMMFISTVDDGLMRFTPWDVVTGSAETNERFNLGQTNVETTRKNYLPSLIQ